MFFKKSYVGRKKNNQKTNICMKNSNTGSKCKGPKVVIVHIATIKDFVTLKCEG